MCRRGGRGAIPVILRRVRRPGLRVAAQRRDHEPLAAAEDDDPRAGRAFAGLAGRHRVTGRRRRVRVMAGDVDDEHSVPFQVGRHPTSTIGGIVTSSAWGEPCVVVGRHVGVGVGVETRSG